MMKRMAVLGLAALLVCAVIGCGAKKPADMPETVPFTVKVVDGGKGIEGVHVFFIYDKNPSISAVTDSSGVAQMSTSLQQYTAKGAPVGDYRVTCTKDPMVEHWKTAQERALMSPGDASAYMKEWQAKCDELPREIPKIWSDFDKTPLKCTVTAGGEVVFDVEGKANE